MSDLINSVLARSRPQAIDLAQGDSLFRRGDAVVRFFQVLSGEIHVLRHLENGAMLVQQRARAGDFVSEPSLHSTSYHCDAVASQPSRLRGVDRAAMLAALRAEPM
ncbi:MAG: cyclic nucleotide-binding domain-containing protein, partial [Rhizobiaceae bacterium]